MISSKKLSVLSVMGLTLLVISGLAFIQASPYSSANSSTQNSATRSGATIFQIASGGDSYGMAQSVGLSLSPVSSGNILVLCLGFVSDNSITMSASTPTDSLGTTFTLVKSAMTLGGAVPSAFAAAWVGTLKASGTDTVTVKYNSGPAGLYAYEITGSSGIIHSRSLTGTNTKSGHVRSYMPVAGSVVAACGGFYQSGGLTPRGGYSLVAQYFPNYPNEDSGGSVWTATGLATNSPFGFHLSVPVWAEVSVSVS